MMPEFMDIPDNDFEQLRAYGAQFAGEDITETIPAANDLVLEQARIIKVLEQRVDALDMLNMRLHSKLAQIEMLTHRQYGEVMSVETLFDKIFMIRRAANEALVEYEKALNGKSK